MEMVPSKGVMLGVILGQVAIRPLEALPHVEGEGVRSTLLQTHMNRRENHDLVHVKLYENHDSDQILKVSETVHVHLKLPGT